MKLAFWAALGSGPAAILLWWLASWAPGAVEQFYSRGLYPAWAAPLSRLVGLLPFALSPWLLLALVLAAVAAFVWLTPLRALAVVAAGASAIVAWFVLGWGLNYQRLSWADAHGWTTPGGTVSSLSRFAERAVNEVNRLRPLVSESRPSSEVFEGVRSAYARSANDPLLAGEWAAPKVFPVADVLSWLGIAGIYLPFLAEPLVNTGPNDWQLPFTAAHEVAHLHGWAREDEANFIAFLVLHDDDDASQAYSAWSSALLYVAQALTGTPEGAAAWATITVHLDPRVKADWKRSSQYWEGFQGPARRVAEAVNDVYLKTQGQSDGVKSYGRMVDLLLAWETRF